jgi:hypothetical protein
MKFIQRLTAQARRHSPRLKWLPAQEGTPRLLAPGPGSDPIQPLLGQGESIWELGFKHHPGAFKEFKQRCSLFFSISVAPSVASFESSPVSRHPAAVSRPAAKRRLPAFETCDAPMRLEIQKRTPQAVASVANKLFAD